MLSTKVTFYHHWLSIRARLYGDEWSEAKNKLMTPNGAGKYWNIENASRPVFQQL